MLLDLRLLLTDEQAPQAPAVGHPVRHPRRRRPLELAPPATLTGRSSLRLEARARGTGRIAASSVTALELTAAAHVRRLGQILRLALGARAVGVARAATRGRLTSRARARRGDPDEALLVGIAAVLLDKEKLT